MQDKHDMPLITADDTVAFSFYKSKNFSVEILQITMCLANLMMSGSATPYLHNGIMDPGEGDDPNFDVSLLLSIFLDVKSFAVWRRKGRNHGPQRDRTARLAN